MSRPIVRAIAATIGEATNPQILINQQAEFLPILAKAGERGIMKAQFSGGLHLGDIVMRLRRKGIMIETVMEPNSGAYGGSHARYILRSKVHIESIPPDKAKAAAGSQRLLNPNSKKDRNLKGGSDVG